MRCSTALRPRSALSRPECTQFDTWLAEMVGKHGEFTVLIILAEIGERSVVPLCSTYLHVIGDEIEWEEVKAVFASSGRAWNGAAFFPTKARNGGPVDKATARQRLAELEAKVKADRMVLNEGSFFDAEGRKIRIEPIADA